MGAEAKQAAAKQTFVLQALINEQAFCEAEQEARQRELASIERAEAKQAAAKQTFVLQAPINRSTKRASAGLRV